MKNAGNNGDKKKMNHPFHKNKNSVSILTRDKSNRDMLKFNIRLQAIKLIIPDGQNGKCCRSPRILYF
ncbi:hypothetical protein NUBL21995_11620 [Klebsiella pneumoniae]|nr:hypothetical protein NUBL21995_11620 [Klebsiella pneumoniae]